MPALCLMLDSPYYAQNYAGILCLSLSVSLCETSSLSAPILSPSPTQSLLQLWLGALPHVQIPFLCSF